MLKKIMLALLASLCCALSVAAAETYRVSPGGLSIGEALSLCADGDTIELSSGVYAEPEEQFPLTVAKSVTICAAPDAQPVVEAPPFAIIFRVEADDVTLRGLALRLLRTGVYALGDRLTMEGCTVSLADSVWRTSSCGVWLSGLYGATLRDCAFYGCGVSMAGPPISESSQGLPVLTGMFEVGEDTGYFTTHTIENCTVNDRALFYAAGQETVQPPQDAGEIICVGCGEVTVENADVSDGSMGMVLVYNDHVTVRDSRADRCGVFGIYVAKCGGGTLENCVAVETNHGLDVRASRHIRLENCEALRCDQGLFFSHVDEGAMVDCRVIETGQGYFTAGGHQNLFLNCLASGCENGFNLQKESDAAVCDCTIEGCTVCGARLDWTPTMFTRNVLRDNWVGVMAYGDVSFSLLGNSFENNQSCGLYLRDIAFSRIAGNTFTGHEKTSVQAVGGMSQSLWRGNTLDLPVTAEPASVFDGL